MAPFGFWTLHALNLSLCAVPKGGSSMNRAVVARGAGVLGAACHYHWAPEATRLLTSRGVSTAYSAATTNIAIVRDPWTRAVSSFVDQMRRGYIPDTGRDAASFLRYLRTNATVERPHHTGSVESKCLGARHARFDHVVDLEDVASFARVARLVPAYGALVERGWEHCTGGDPRLYMPGSVATVNPHRNADVELKHALCTPEALRQVCWTYRRDSEVYERLGHPFECRCEATVRRGAVAVAVRERVATAA